MGERWKFNREKIGSVLKPVADGCCFYLGSDIVATVRLAKKCGLTLFFQLPRAFHYYYHRVISHMKNT